MTIAEIMKKMIELSDRNLKDINHLIKVWTYAKVIGEMEKLDGEKQYILEAAAIVHDIACPLCREKYGNCNGKYQEQEGPALVYDFFENTDLTEKQKGRVAYLVGHHHTISDIDGLDYQILIEADYIVNAEEKAYLVDSIKNFCEKTFKTKAGTALLKSLFDLSGDVNSCGRG